MSALLNLNKQAHSVRQQWLSQQLLLAIQQYQQHLPAWLELIDKIALDKVTSLEDIHILPITAKDDFTRLQQQNPPFGGLRCVGNSPLFHLFVSPGPIYEFDTHCADFWGFEQVLDAIGMDRSDSIANAFSYHYTPAGIMFDEAAKRLSIPILPAGPGNTTQLIEAINHFKLTTFVGTPDFLKIIIDKAHEQNTPLKSLNKAVVSGGYLSPEIRQLAQNNGIYTLQCYATADVGLIAYETIAEEGLVCAEHVWIEIVNPKTLQPVTHSEVGEIVVSRLSEHAPLLRFATGDLSTLLSEPSPCGRTHQRIKGWMGRSDESVKVRGQFIRPSQMNNLLKRLPQIESLQLQVHTEKGIDYLQLHLYGNDADNQQVQSAFREITGLRCEVMRANVPLDSLIKDQRSTT